MGFGELSDDKLQFDLTEGARAVRSPQIDLALDAHVYGGRCSTGSCSKAGERVGKRANEQANIRVSDRTSG